MWVHECERRHGGGDSSARHRQRSHGAQLNARLPGMWRTHRLGLPRAPLASEQHTRVQCQALRQPLRLGRHMHMHARDGRRAGSNPASDIPAAPHQRPRANPALPVSAVDRSAHAAPVATCVPSLAPTRVPLASQHTAPRRSAEQAPDLAISRMPEQRSRARERQRRTLALLRLRRAHQARLPQQRATAMRCASVRSPP